MMEDKDFLAFYRDFMAHEGSAVRPDVRRKVKEDLKKWYAAGGVDPEYIIKPMRTAMIAHREIGLGHHAIEAIMLYDWAIKSGVGAAYIEGRYSQGTCTIVKGLYKAYSLYEKHVAVETENFRKLLMSIAQDVRVVMIMIVERLDTMRNLTRYREEEREEIAREVAYLYAPMAHRMGLYAIKTELEDLSLKYTAHDIYKEIAHKLNETKRSRDAYIARFIEPVRERLARDGLKFDIKGRTKSIYSIWNKMRKQQVPFEKVYDLFAIRIIIDCPEEQEKSACWQAFSVVTDMYTPNTNRLRDWISVPKANGYESLHITVMSPEGKWVEVQIRTRRMDEVAEKGVAAHWKYKGIKSDSAQMDEWLKNLRDLLEHSDDTDGRELVDEFKMQLYDDDVFVFTPKGDLHRLSKGATVLDFAFGIHTSIGCHCTGAIVNGKHESFRYMLKNGDQVNILTSPSQSPRLDWLNYAVTSKARYRIKQALKEAVNKEADDGRETLLRRLKNWKLTFDDSDIARFARKAGHKDLTSFYVAIHNEKIDLTELKDFLTGEESAPAADAAPSRSASGFAQETELQKISTKGDALVIDRNLRNVDYTLAKCCNPIYGDEVFGFVTVNGGIKIHKKDCPNAPQMISRFGYRIVKAVWSGDTGGTEYSATLNVLGNDDIGIVANITSVISKEAGVNMRSISVDSHDGLFEGKITVTVGEVSQLDRVIKKIKAVKGVKQVSRS